MARMLLRMAIYPPLAMTTLADYGMFGGTGLRARVTWLQRCARLHLRWCGLKVRVWGTVPESGLIVANHVSYLDVIALAAIMRCAFVAKKEVASWPLFGGFARMGASVFVDRERRGAVSDAIGEMRLRLDAGIPIVLFPEGSSTDGSKLLPFRTSLFEPAVALECPLVACGLRYQCPDGDVGKDLAFWGDMSLVPQVIRMLTKSGASLDIRFGPPRRPTGGRKALAREFEKEVRQLAGLPVSG